MKSVIILAAFVAITLVNVGSAGPTVGAVTHTEFQAVDAGGEHVYSNTDKVILEGILLHNPADMLDPTPDDTNTQMFNLGGTWQIFFQGEGEGMVAVGKMTSGAFAKNQVVMVSQLRVDVGKFVDSDHRRARRGETLDIPEFERAGEVAECIKDLRMCGHGGRHQDGPADPARGQPAEFVPDFPQQEQ